MAGAQLGTALRQIQRLFSDGSSTGLIDTQLLNRFAKQRDEAAFAAVLTRHGPMVLAVCRACWAIPSTPRMPSRRPFLFWPGKPVRREWTASSAGGCTKWPIASLSGRAPMWRATSRDRTAGVGAGGRTLQPRRN
jgi:hypothetical protein